MNISHGRDAHPEFAMLLDNIDSMEQPEKKKVRYKPESGASGVFSDRFYLEKNYYNFLSDSSKNISKLIDELVEENRVVSFGNNSDRLILSDRFIKKLIISLTSYSTLNQTRSASLLTLY